MPRPKKTDRSKAKTSASRKRSRSAAPIPVPAHPEGARQLVILTGLSGSGKLSALKAFEDMGFYAVDNLPVELLPNFAELVSQSVEITRAALVVDAREGRGLERFPAILKDLRRKLAVRVIFLEASRAALLRRFSETRRPHPLGHGEMVSEAIRAEEKLFAPVRKAADIVVDSTNFNVHELRAYIQNEFRPESTGKSLLVSSISFGYKHGVPLEADLVFDVRFLPNPHFVPEFRHLTGRNKEVIAYLDQFPQTKEFLDRVTDLLLFLLPHYIREGKSYLTIAFGCTGGQHRSVMISEEIARRLAKHGYQAKTAHRDMPR
ncbi:MAG TPA: RNase adapter RapZ [Acidobacteriaceae bacterium]|nr:RNase adapter RapZ [Acidobacteriaceae bacterium]